MLPPDEDWESKGVLRHFWQKGFEDRFKPNFMSPLGHVYYPHQCYDGTT